MARGSRSTPSAIASRSTSAPTSRCSAAPTRIVFGGGIGENSPEIRERICRSLAWAGLGFDASANREPQADVPISAAGAMQAWVVHVDEAEIIARDVAECLRASS